MKFEVTLSRTYHIDSNNKANARKEAIRQLIENDLMHCLGAGDGFFTETARKIGD